MNAKKSDSGAIGLQIDAPSRASSPRPSMASLDMTGCARNLPKPLSLEEKKYLLAVERGDLANVRRMLQRAHRKKIFDINCVDSLGRGALTIAIDAEHLEMVELLVIMSVETKDALLQAINAEFVEAVELLLEHEELIHKEGELYSWQKVEINTSMFTPDITPLILAAHKNNYEILKILLDRGATVPTPHDIRCGCDDCIRKSTEDSLRFSLSRVNEYRALASPSLIALSSTDPLLTAFRLSWELRSLAFAEQECKSEYLDLRRQCQQFAVDLLDQSRSSQELAIILNHDPDAPPYADGDHMQLTRLELAINYKQKKFVAHPNIQQLLASLWYQGVPGFRRKAAVEKLLIIFRVVVFFPLYCMMYMLFPGCSSAKLMRKPFMKFLIHASSYLFFLFILILVSQRAEVHVILMFGTESMRRAMEDQLRRQRGNGPSPLEYLVVLYVIGFIWEETQEIFNEGIRSYLRNMWNFIDFSRNSLYCLTALLRAIAYVQQNAEIARDPSTAYIAREHWDDFDPQLIAEGLFAAANIFSAIKLVHLFSINPHLGPLQISLGRMVIDIVKFFFIYSLVLFAFACGLNQLLWYFADLEYQKCYHKPNGMADWENMGDACMKWRRFGNLFESSQSLFWASFGMVGLENFELEGIKSYTRFWGLLMFGSYSVINVIVLLNLLIAMMSNSYAMIDEHSDTEWKFARTKLWMSYFEESGTLPPPFNILPSVKQFLRLFKGKKSREIKRGSTIRRKEDRENRYTNVIRSLVWRYVSAMQRRYDDSAVTEDDINEVKADISAMRYEFLEVFERNGMDVSFTERKEKSHLAKRMKVWERRLMKDFHVAPTTVEEGGEEREPSNEKGLARFRRVAHAVVNQTSSHKWTEAVQGVTDTQIGRCRNRESFRNQQNLARAMTEARKLVEHSPIQSRPCTPLEYNDPTTNTLLELLKNITEEIGEYTPNRPGSRSPSRPASKQDRDNSIAQLHAMLENCNKTPSPLPSHIVQLAETVAKVEDYKQQRQSISSNNSRLIGDFNQVKTSSRSPSIDLRGFDVSAAISSPPPLPQSPPPLPVQSPTKPQAATRVKSPETAQRKSITSLGSTGSIGAEATAAALRSPSPTSKSAPLPEIQITRTESNRSTVDEKWVKPEKMDEDKQKPGVPKVVKRRAPAPSSDSSDISISRPVVTRVDHTKGMIPPPPIKVPAPLISTTSTSAATSSSKPEPYARPVSPKPGDRRPSSSGPSRKSPTPPPPKPLDSINSSFTPQSMESITDSSENLVKSTEPSSEANQAAASPPSSLRVQRKVTDVTTIKRQPKTGWL